MQRSLLVLRLRVEAARMSVEIFPDAEGVALAAAERIEAVGCGRIGLAGGSTPRRLYALLAARNRMDWARVHVYWSDERAVPPDDPASNYRMAREALLDRVPIPPAQVHRIPTELPPDAAAAAYARTLREAFPASAPHFDVLLLGMGADGHTASLFPGALAIHEETRWVVATEAPVAPHARITLTPPALCADLTLVLATGAEKAEALRAVHRGPWHPDRVPAQLVRDAVWLVDAAAARLLT
jgi:6-phosphogluconolactonase